MSVGAIVSCAAMSSVVCEAKRETGRGFPQAVRERNKSIGAVLAMPAHVGSTSTDEADGFCGTGRTKGTTATTTTRRVRDAPRTAAQALRHLDTRALVQRELAIQDLLAFQNGTIDNG